jgi:Ni/Co efflux regulator RcnB
LLEDYRERCRAARRTTSAVLSPLIHATYALGSGLKGCDVPLSSEFQETMLAVEKEVRALEKQIQQRDYTKDQRALPDLAAAGKGLLRLAAQVRRTAGPLAQAAADGEADKEARRTLKQRQQECEAAWQAAADAIHHNNYLTHHLEWLLHRFPRGVFQPVPGLCRVVTRADIAAADWSLTPGRYVGVAPAEVDEDFDFEQAITGIHEELATLNADAVELAATIQKNLEELGG